MQTLALDYLSGADALEGAGKKKKKKKKAKKKAPALPAAQAPAIGYGAPVNWAQYLGEGDAQPSFAPSYTPPAFAAPTPQPAVMPQQPMRGSLSELAGGLSFDDEREDVDDWADVPAPEERKSLAELAGMALEDEVEGVEGCAGINPLSVIAGAGCGCDCYNKYRGNRIANPR